MEPDMEEAVRDGRKTVDVRVNIKPFADVDKGDVIRYRSAEVRVKRIRAYPGLSDLIAYEGWKRIIPWAKDQTEAHARLLKKVSHESPTHGLLAFEIELISG
jgi:ASC-1-like (ASCH) protein